MDLGPSIVVTSQFSVLKLVRCWSCKRMTLTKCSATSLSPPRLSGKRWCRARRIHLMTTFMPWRIISSNDSLYIGSTQSSKSNQRKGSKCSLSKICNKSLNYWKKRRSRWPRARISQLSGRMTRATACRVRRTKSRSKKMRKVKSPWNCPS